MTSVPLFRSRQLLAVLATMLLGFCIAPLAFGQTTYTWAPTGVSPAIDASGNWVGGVAPNFAGDATTDSAIFSASTNTAIQLRNVTTGDTFASATFDVSAPAYTFSLPAGNTTNDLIILPNGSMTNNSAHTQDFTALPDININGAAGFPGVLAAANGDASTKLSFDLHQLTFDNIDASTGHEYDSGPDVPDITSVLFRLMALRLPPCRLSTPETGPVEPCSSPAIPERTMPPWR